MKQNGRFVAVVAMCAIASVGCYHFRHSAASSIQKNMTMQPLAGKKTAKPFTVKKGWCPMWLWGVAGKEIPVDEWIAQEIGRNKTVGNVQIETQMSFLNGLAHFVTFGIYSPHTVTITGKYQ